MTAPSQASASPPAAESGPTSPTLWDRWNALPLYLRILIAMIGGIAVGLALGKHAAVFELPSKIILQLLGALAPPLILIAVIHVLMTTELKGKTTWRLGWLLLLNTTVAILIGLTVANVVKPGGHQTMAPVEEGGHQPDKQDLVGIVSKNIPRSLLGPLGDQQNIIGVILIAVAFGIAFRKVKHSEAGNLRWAVEIAYESLLVVLHWIINLVPIGVFAIVAKVVGVEGFEPFKALGAFVFAVILALALQTGWYLIRIRLKTWVRPLPLLRGMRDALLMAFSTGSSTATMPVTYACLKDKVGLREESASMGALVGSNFNNDGTALYEAMAALFVAQLLGMELTPFQQLLIVLTSIVASVGAAGIPEAGLVTMTLVFTAVGLPTQYIAILLAVDWFLDRCRTMINVLGDVNVSCLLDGPTRGTAPEPATALAGTPAPPSSAG
jgi:Na+/H+-dicarboxylate symporter